MMEFGPNSVDVLIVYILQYFPSNGCCLAHAETQSFQFRAAWQECKQNRVLCTLFTAQSWNQTMNCERFLAIINNENLQFPVLSATLNNKHDGRFYLKFS